MWSGTAGHGSSTPGEMHCKERIVRGRMARLILGKILIYTRSYLLLSPTTAYLNDYKANLRLGTATGIFIPTSYFMPAPSLSSSIKLTIFKEPK